jgi:hypothetical protein
MAKQVSLMKNDQGACPHWILIGSIINLRADSQQQEGDYQQSGKTTAQ